MRNLSEHLALTAIFVATTLVPCHALASSKEDLKPKFQARYDALTRAYNAKDLKLLGKFLAPTFRTGSDNREAFLDKCAKSNGMLKTTSRTVLMVLINKDKASTMVKEITVGTFPDRKSGANHKLEIETMCADTWAKYPTGWQVKQMKTVHAKVTEDGKPYTGRIQG